MRWEQGKVEPSFRSLTTLLDACGVQLELTAAEDAGKAARRARLMSLSAGARAARDRA